MIYSLTILELSPYKKKPPLRTAGFVGMLQLDRDLPSVKTLVGNLYYQQLLVAAELWIELPDRREKSQHINQSCEAIWQREVCFVHQKPN